MLTVQGSGAWPYAGLSLLKIKKSLIVIQIVQTLHTSANILHVCIHKNVLTMFQQKLQLLVNSESSERYSYLLMQRTKFEVK